jgi:hypothetical protein
MVHRPTRRGDARVGADDVEPSEFGHAGGYCILQHCPITYIGDTEQGPPPALLNQPGRLLEVGVATHPVGNRVHVGHGVDADDIGALLCQSHCMRTALTARDPGDEGDFALDTAHV